MSRVLMPLADGFEEIEALAVVDVLRRAGIEVITAGLSDGPIKSCRNVRILPDTLIDSVNSSEFDTLVLPGGQPGTDNLNADPRIHTLLAEFNSNCRLIGAICAAPSILSAAGLLAGKRATSYPTYSDRLNVAYYENKPVIHDGNIVTSQGAGTAIEFALKIVELLVDHKKSAEVASAMLVHGAVPSIWNHQLFNSTIQALVGALEMKDTFTQGHANRVTEFSLCIGAKLKLSGDEMRDLYLGAILHDIGKIGTSDDVLNKPDLLNRHEETLVREHPMKGTLFIVGIDNLSHIVPTILHHHERWDGNGYPGRLKGDQIPLHARIVSVADAFDAMTSNRSFRNALDREVAIRELLRQKGTHFDPFIVDVFVECLNDSPFEMKDFSYYF